MKTIGILGGIGPASTAIYYNEINRDIRAELGGAHSGDIRLHSVNFAEIADAQARDDWPFMENLMANAAKGLERSGADFIILACNTMHMVAPAIVDAIGIPFLHIVDACRDQLIADGRTRPGLLGSTLTMTGDYFTGRLKSAGELSPMVPDASVHTEINRVIHDELSNGTVLVPSRTFYEQQVEVLKQNGADSVILGCTEIGLLLSDENSALPVYDTSLIHCRAAVDYALSKA